MLVAVKNFCVVCHCERSEVEDAPLACNLFNNCKSQDYFAPLRFARNDWNMKNEAVSSIEVKKGIL
jgi:hypothetical protein